MCPNITKDTKVIMILLLSPELLKIRESVLASLNRKGLIMDYSLFTEVF